MLCVGIGIITCMTALSLNKFAQEGRTERVVLCVGIGMIPGMAAFSLFCGRPLDLDRV